MKLKNLCLAISVLFLFQNCNRAIYPSLNSTSNVNQDIAPFSYHYNTQFENLSAFQANTELVPVLNSEIQIKDSNNKEVINAKAPLTITKTKQAHTVLNTLNKKEVIEIVRNTSESRIQLDKESIPFKAKETNKTFVNSGKPQTGEGYFAGVLIGLGILLALLIQSSLGALAVIGLMLGAVALALFFLVLVFASGGFGKIGG